MRIHRSIISLLSGLALVSLAQAGDVFKANNTTALNVAASWTGSVLPTPSDVVVWDTPFSNSAPVTMGDNLSWAGIRIASPTVVPAIRNTSGKTITLGSAGIDMSAATQNFALNPNVTVGVSQTWNIKSERVLTLANGIVGTGLTVTKSGAGTVSLGGLAVYEPNFKLDAGTVLAATGTVALTGTLSGAGGNLLVNSTGSLTLSASNTFSGGTTVAAGQLNLNHANALGTGPLTITGGSLDNTSGSPITLAGNAQNWNGDFAYAGSADLNLGSGAVTVSGNRILTVTDKTLTVGGTMTGTAGLTKAGSGALAFPAGGTLTLTGQLGVNGGDLKLAGGSITCSGMVFGGSSTATFQLDGGTLTTGPVSRIGGTATFSFNGGTLVPAADSTAFMSGLSAAIVRAGGARIQPNGGSITIAQPLLHDAALGAAPDGGLTLTGGGTLTLTGTCTYTGPTTVTAGTLVLGSGGSLAASPVIDLGTEGTFDGTGTGATLAAGQTLTGTGNIYGKLTIGTGSTLAPGGSATIGTLGGNADLILLGVTNLQLSKAGTLPSNDSVVSSSVKFGGTLVVTASGSALAAGDSFKLFDASTYSGSFATLNLPVLPSGNFWDIANLTVDGTITVINTVPVPTLSPPAGGYVGAQSVTISSLSGSTIRYTKDGSDPATSPTAVSGPSPLSGVAVPAATTGFTVKAYATMAGFNPSPVVSAVYNTLSFGTWINDSSDGAWSDPANWLLGAVATGSSITADFSTLTLSGNRTVTLGSSRMIGLLKFGDLGDAGNWTLQTTDGAVLTLDAGSATPEIQTANRTTTIMAPLAGTHGLRKTGAGSMVTQLASPLSGDVVISQGEVRIDKTGSLGSGSITLGDADTGAVEVRLAQRGSDPWPPTDARCTNNILVGAGPTGRVVIARQNAGNYAGIFTGTITLANNVVLRNDGGDRLAIEGKITGTGNVTVEGGRINWDNTANDFLGTVTIAAGCLLQINGNNVIPATSDATVDGTMGFNSDAATALTLASLNGGGAVSIPYGGGNPVLTVGTQDHNGSFSGVISSRIALIKTGTGTQTFTGTNTYTGATTVNAGNLVINGALSASSAVTVAATGTMGGTGTVPGSVTAAGAIAPGDNGTGTLTTGATVLTGTYACQLDGANCDMLAVAGNLTLTGSTLAVSVLAGGAAQSSYVIATYTGSRTGAFATVTGLPAGYTVDYATANQIRLVGTNSGFASWIAGYGLTGSNALPNADPDRDAVPNAVEYVVGGNPAAVMDAALMPTLTLVTNPGGSVPAGNYLKFSFRQTPASAYLNPGMEYDADLTGTWTPATGAPGVVQVVTPNAFTTPTPADRVDVYVPRSGNEANGRLFGRLRVSLP